MANQGILDGNAPKQYGKIGALSGVMLGWSAVSNIGTRFDNGDGFIGGTIKGLSTTLIEDGASSLLGKHMLPYQLAKAGIGLSDAAINYGKNNAGRVGDAINGMTTMIGKDAIHTKNATNMRNRGMNMINDQGENVRSTFGSEARAYFRSTQ